MAVGCSAVIDGLDDVDLAAFWPAAGGVVEITHGPHGGGPNARTRGELRPYFPAAVALKVLGGAGAQVGADVLVLQLGAGVAAASTRRLLDRGDLEGRVAVELCVGDVADPAIEATVFVVEVEAPVQAVRLGTGCPVKVIRPGKPATHGRARAHRGSADRSDCNDGGRGSGSASAT